MYGGLEQGNRYHRDLGLLRLGQSVPCTDARPLRLALPVGSQVIPTNANLPQTARLEGYGGTVERLTLSVSLISAQTVLGTPAMLHSMWGWTSYSPSEGSVTGDSGGPLLLNEDSSPGAEGDRHRTVIGVNSRTLPGYGTEAGQMASVSDAVNGRWIDRVLRGLDPNVVPLATDPLIPAGWSREGCGGVDNCPNAHNPTQTDSDGDGRGDACDLCPNQSVAQGDIAPGAPQSNCNAVAEVEPLDAPRVGVVGRGPIEGVRADDAPEGKQTGVPRASDHELALADLMRELPTRTRVVLRIAHTRKRLDARMDLLAIHRCQVANLLAAVGEADRDLVP